MEDIVAKFSAMKLSFDDDKKAIQIHDRKIDALEDIIESMNGRPLLVAYWFKHDYDRIITRLAEVGVQYAKLDTNESIPRIPKTKNI